MLVFTENSAGGVDIAGTLANGNIWHGTIDSTGALVNTSYESSNSCLSDGGVTVISGFMASAKNDYHVRQAYVDPLLLDLSGDGITLTSIKNSNAWFDLYGTGYAVKTGWVGATTGILVSTPTPTSINDLFGNATTDGFTALKALDTNNDNLISASDTGFSNLHVLVDATGGRAVM